MFRFGTLRRALENTRPNDVAEAGVSLLRFWAKNFAAAAVQLVSMPLLPPAGRVGRQAKSGPPEVTEEESEKRRGPGTTALESRWDGGLVGQSDKRPPAHSKSWMLANVTCDDNRAGPHFKRRSLATVAANGEDPAAHTLASDLAGIPLDNHHSAPQAVVASRKCSGDVVACGPFDSNKAAVHFGRQPVAGAARDFKQPAGHALAGVTADVASGANRARGHAGANVMNATEVAMALDGEVAQVALHFERVTELTRSLVGADGQLANSVQGEGCESLGHDSRKANGKRPARCCID